jgi:hypothetical protein
MVALTPGCPPCVTFNVEGMELSHCCLIAVHQEVYWQRLVLTCARCRVALMQDCQLVFDVEIRGAFIVPFTSPKATVVSRFRVCHSERRHDCES